MPEKMSLSVFIDGYIKELSQALATLDKKRIEKVVNILLKAYTRGKKVFIIGNGGSAATASHMACDLSKGTLRRVYDISERRLRVYSLTDNVATLTAYGNDLAFEDIFVQQLRNLVDPGDVVLALSGSGNSPNLVCAIKYAKKCRAKTIGILGFMDGGKLGKIVDEAIIIQSRHYGPCEDIQLVLDHILTSWISIVKHEGKKSRNKAVPFK